MSYILDALKKAERERGIAQVPTLATVHDLRATPRFRLWAVSGLFMLGVAVLLWFFLPASRRVPSNAGEPVRVASKPEVGRIGESAHGTEVLPSATVPPAETMINVPGVSARKPAVNERRSNQSTQASTVQQQSKPQPGISSPAERAPVQQPPPGAGRSSPEEGTRSPDAPQGKPASLRDAMAKMTMSIHLYSESQAERLVFINGRKYVEGDYVEGTYLLESITPEGAVLVYEGERAILLPRPK